MTYIDWSDSEGVFGLLLDWIADERGECGGDPGRQRFLSELLAHLRAMAARLPDTSPAAVIQNLKDTCESVDPDFGDDPAMVHLRDCIEELERIESGAA